MYDTLMAHFLRPPGTGKSIQVKAALDAVAKAHPTLDTYVKMGALDRFWDGYDNQPFVLINDTNAPVEAFKNIISGGEHIVEIKFGSMQFTSHLVIIISQQRPRDAGIYSWNVCCTCRFR